ncbi:MAG: zf-HC2 domain-containing protein [Butyricicoccus sp.]|nr:zf-HC2 domain-containing protein [Butyricicoccus sp.]
MPDCIYFENLCSASVDGTLTRAEKKELEAHLAECPACREYLEDMRVMRTLWRELDDPAPAGLHGSIMAAVQADLAQQKEENEAAAPADNVVAIPVREKPAPLQAKKRMRSVVLMLGAAAACVALVMSGGLSGGLIGMVGVNDTASDAAAAAPAAEAPAAAAPQEPMLYAAASTANGARVANEVLQDSAAEEYGEETEAANAPAAGKLQSAPRLPDAVAERQFAASYLAAGVGEVPVIEGAVLLTQENGCSYYSLPNDISVLEEVFDVLPGAGYTITVTESTTGEGTEGSVTADSAELTEVLLIIMTQE